MWAGELLSTLFHFSDDPAIEEFVPRAVCVPAVRAAGREWLNGPLVWAIDAAHQPLYLFPRDCPRILVWPTAATTAADRAEWFAGRSCRMLAYVEQGWLARIAGASIHRYTLPSMPFESLDDAGMWVAREPVRPLAMETIDDLPAALGALHVDVVAVSSLLPLKQLWDTSLHASGIRLRNAAGWS